MCSEIWSKGWVYVCEDVRREVLIASQRLSHLQHAIEVCCNECPSIASLSESATLRLRKGRTGSFVVRRLARDDAPAYLDERRALFAKTLIAAVSIGAWHVEAVAQKESTPSHGDSCDTIDFI